MIYADHVLCEAYTPEGFPQAPYYPNYNQRGNSVTVTKDGNFNWAGVGDIGRGDDVILGYDQTYHYFGWTVLSSFEGTRFTNDGTGHGMFVSVDNVYSF
jgi:hypothetical protein